MIVDSFDYIACYKGLHPNLDKAIDWLNSHTLDALENGKTIIDGENVFVNVMDADLRDADGALIYVSNDSLYNVAVHPGSTVTVQLSIDSDLCRYYAENGVTIASVESMACAISED